MKFQHYIFISLILLLISPTRSQNSSFTYDEVQIKSPIIYDIKTYNDNRVVVRIIRENSTATVKYNVSCFDNYLWFRTIYPDGSVVPIDISLNIPDINFCLNVLEISPIRDRFLLVNYVNATDFDDGSTYKDWAMIIDLDGKTYGYKKNQH